MSGGIRAHVLQCERLGLAFEVGEERHMAGEMWHVLDGDSAAPIHPGKIVDAVLAALAHVLADDLPRTQHSHDLLGRTLEDASARIAHDGIERMAEAIGLHGCRLNDCLQCLILIHVD